MTYLKPFVVCSLLAAAAAAPIASAQKPQGQIDLDCPPKETCETYKPGMNWSATMWAPEGKKLSALFEPGLATPELTINLSIQGAAVDEIKFRGNATQGYTFDPTGEKFSIHLLMDPRSKKGDIFPEAFVYSQLLGKLTEAKVYNAKLTATSISYGVVATESFKIDMTGNGREQAKLMLAALADKAAKFRTMAAPKMKNPQLTAQMTELMKAKGYDARKVVITSSDWELYRHPVSGVITSRALWTQVAYKDKSGKFKVAEIEFEQPATGGGQYGALKYKGWGSAGEFDIAESNLK